MKKQKKQTRRMHYVSAFNLAEFTDGRTRDSMLTVFEPRTERCFQNKADNVAFERDLYIVEPDEEHPDRDPQQIERFFADFEGSCAATVRTVADTKRLPDPHTAGVDQLLWLAALMKVRTPRARRIWSDLTARDFEDHTRKIVATPEAWAQALREMPGLSTSGIGDWTYEKARDHFEHLRVTVSGQNWYTKLMLDDARTYRANFGKKRWTLFVASDGSPDFITSDFPGFLQWFPLNIARPLPADGDLLNDFRLAYYLPLSRRCALVGMLPPKEIRRFVSPQVTVPAGIVGEINAMTLLTCERFVFSAANDFTFSATTHRGSWLRKYSQVKGYVRENLEAADQKLRERLSTLGTWEN